ncbi:MAG: DUF2147 domain-containing protein [Loktanella sp.]|nr:DUF2147 domain-containing protein [Loktanella sp.]
MKHLILAAAAAFGLAGAASAQDAAIGTWQTEVDDGAFAYITIAPCGAAVCGSIARTFNSEGEYQSPNLGRQIVIDMAPNGDGSYNGQVWRPSNDRIYMGKMDVAGDALRLRGCVAGGLICASQNWVRIE